jgi:magnesium-transporting ATPase (P-type)
MTDREIAQTLPRLAVVCRALPTDKSRLVRAAQNAGLVVGMTGDGVNDAPALRLSDVGFAMGSGTGVAQMAGDIVILDDNIASIAKAILYGRTIFKSIQKFIVFQLIMNLCAVGVSLIGPFIGVDAPVTVAQMLWINLIMDTLAGLAFAGEPPLAEYMEEPPKKRASPVMTRQMAGRIAALGLYIVAVCVLFLKSPTVRIAFGGQAHLTGFFALFVFCGVAGGFCARTPRINILHSLRQNPSFVGIMAGVCAVQAALIFFGGPMFRAFGLSLRQLFLIFLLAMSTLAFDCGRKALVTVWRGRVSARQTGRRVKNKVALRGKSVLS